ncbi:protocadherin Fat 4-like [Saccostrea echinata]|uniref:protocadherin Fat 4-like n=1 Tax=Saccostrea echinata TaxID=191078 RepID=UPI002A80FDE0|nr:protocadherin Fat 4-like [Saccostrea echinata]
MAEKINFFRCKLVLIVFFCVIHIINALTISNLPTAVDLREDTSAETLLHTVSYTGVTTGDTVTCSMNTVTNFFMKIVTGTTNYGVYVVANPAGLAYPSSYTISVTCTGSPSSATDTKNLEVHITQNSPPSITNVPASISVDSTTTGSGVTIFTIQATDAEGDQLYFEIVCDPTGCPFEVFASGAILTTASLEGTQVGGYDINVYVNDSRSKVGPKVLSVAITNVNSPPTITNKLTTPVSVSENVAVGTTVRQYTTTDVNGGVLTYSATYSPASGGTYFTIESSSGIVKTASSINYETLSVAERTVLITVTVRDAAAASDTTTLTVSIIDQNEAPAFPKDSYTLITNEAGAGASIGNPNFQATDPDASSTLTYSTTCTDITIDSATGAASFTSAYDMDEAGKSGTITCPVTVSDGSLTDTATLTITVNNINDNTPSFGQSAYTFTTANTVAVGTRLGSIAATDGDLSTSLFGTITYELNQLTLGGDYFGVTSTGSLYVKAAITSLSSGSTYTITATARDGGLLSDTASITIIIPSTTTTTTTTTDRAQTFFEDPRNIAWFTAAMIVLALTIGLITYMCIRYGFQFKKYQKTYRSRRVDQDRERLEEYIEGNWRPWKVWDKR